MLRPKRIVLVDDQSPDRQSIKFMIGRRAAMNGHAKPVFQLAGSYVEACECIHEIQAGDAPDLFLIDLQIPIAIRSIRSGGIRDFPGLDLCRLIRTQHPDMLYLPMSQWLDDVRRLADAHAYREELARAVDKSNLASVAARVCDLLQLTLPAPHQ